MFENPRRGRQAINFTTNVPKILDLKSSSEQIFPRKLPLGAPALCERYNDFCHCKPSELLRVVERRCRLSTWSFRCNLALHPKKTKVILLSTPQMSQTHGLDGHFIHLCANGKSLKRVLTFRLLGTEVHENVTGKEK